MLDGCVSAHIYFVRSKVVTCCVMKWRRERFQANYGRVSHELRFSLCFNLSPEHARNFTDLAKLWALMIQNSSLWSSLPWLPLQRVRFDGSVELSEEISSVLGERSFVFGFIGNQGFIYSTTNSDYSFLCCCCWRSPFFRRSWSVFCGFL